MNRLKSHTELKLISLTLSALLTGSGCAVVGKEDPVAMKSEGYRIMSISKNFPSWEKLEPLAKEPETENVDGDKSNNASDLAYQSHATNSIISLNSACRSKIEDQRQNLAEFTDLLLLGLTNIEFRKERQFLIHQVPALETTVKGYLNSEEVQLKTVVVRKSDCIYDLMYISRPDLFEKEAHVFSKFVSSFRIH